jgi:Putative adhesin
VSITEDAPVQAPPQLPGPQPRKAAWWWLVAACALVLVGVAAMLAIWWAATRETRTTSYRVLGELSGIRLDLGDADVEIDGGGAAVEVRRIDRFAYGAPSEETRTIEAGTLSIVSRCPDQVLGSCRASYRLTVPDNVPIDVETSSGAVRISAVRASVQVNTHSGPISAAGFCGFLLRASSDTGDVSAVSECPPERFELRSRSGDVHAVVPAGRYEIDAQSESGVSRVRGLSDADDAPFQVQALSTSGNVLVEADS